MTVARTPASLGEPGDGVVSGRARRGSAAGALHDADRLVLITAVLAAVGCAWFVLALAGLRGPAVLGWAPMPLSALTCTVLCLRTSRAARRQPATRSFWLTMTAAIALAGLGGLSQYGDITTRPGAGPVRAGLAKAAAGTGGPAGPAEDGVLPDLVTMAIYLGVLLLIVWALARLPANRITRIERITAVLDAGTVMLASALVLWCFVTEPMLRAQTLSNGTLPAVAGVTGLPVLIFIVTRLSLGEVICVDRGALRLLALDLTLAVTGSVPQVWLGGKGLVIGQYALPLCSLLLALAARRQLGALREPALLGADDRSRSHSRRSLGLLPYAAVAVGNALLIDEVVREHGSDLLVVAIGAVTLTGLVVARQLIVLSENARLLRRLDHETKHDALTRLPNRARFKERLRQSLSTADTGRNVSVALIDLDEFKTVNDTLGHAAGDDLLVAVARRLRDDTPADAGLARMGGDEFALVLEDLTPDDVDVTLRRLLSLLGSPFVVRGHELKIEASVGIADGQAGDAPGELLRHADVAMYAAKANGGGITHYLPGMETGLLDQVRMYDELRQAVDEDQLRLVYQPLVALPEGRLIGVEALVRWAHPARGLLAPGAFVPLAERTGAILLLGRWVLQEACRQAAQWQARFGRAAPAVNVNVSPRQLKEAAFASEVMTVIERHGLDPASVTIEVTETSTVTDQVSLDNLRRLHDHGVRIALDDFGTAQSSLSLLHACPVDELKLDRAFAQAVRAGGDSSVAGAVIQLARTFDLDVVAEGTETQEQADWLYSLGYRVAQGYHFGRPMPPEDVDSLIAAQAAEPLPLAEGRLARPRGRATGRTTGRTTGRASERATDRAGDRRPPS